MSHTITRTSSYTKEHGGRALRQIATVGITEFAVNPAPGDITLVELPKGAKFQREQVAATVESVKAVSDIFRALTGTIHPGQRPAQRSAGEPQRGTATTRAGCSE